MIEAGTYLPPTIGEPTPFPPRRPLAEIPRPHARILRLHEHGDRMAVDDQFAVSFRFLQAQVDREPSVNIIIAKRRGLYVVFPKSPHDTYDPPPAEHSSIYNAMFVDGRHSGEFFYLGERYALGFALEPGREDRDPIDLLVASQLPLRIGLIDPAEKDRDYLERVQQAPAPFTHG